MHKITFTDRARYWFDNFMTKGTLALIAGLAVVRVNHTVIKTK